ncbi:MAG: FtsW/RodA/SpoVE family cell cycle protein [Bacilli bacterium]|nr:FtsW/RodA/SpoVE family cell cycle protein [Bacilli bacterium]
MRKYIKKYKIESICLIIIIMFSLINIYKAPLLDTKYKLYFYKQILWIITGIILFIITYKIEFKHIFKIRNILYLINILMLMYVLFFSKTTNGIRAWITIGPVSLQPSEFIKITFPLCSLKIIKDKKYLLSFLLFLTPSILILLEPDTGNFIFLLLIYFYMLINKTNKKIMIFILLFFILSLFFSIIAFKYYPTIMIKLFNGKLYYRFKRILEYKNNYQINNALIGIGSSKLLPIKLNRLLIYIPEGITDFIFSYNICNNGILLTIILLLTITIFSYKLLSRYHKKLFFYKKKLLGSFLTIFIIQTIYNIFMNIGLVPIMGIPLPFISYGGSNIITYFILYALATKPISYKDSNNYKSSYHKVLVDKKYNHMVV